MIITAFRSMLLGQYENKILFMHMREGMSLTVHLEMEKAKELREQLITAIQEAEENERAKHTTVPIGSKK